MGQNIMKNKIDFQKVLVTWKAKPERNAKQLFSFGLQNTAPSLGQKKYGKPYAEKLFIK